VLVVDDHDETREMYAWSMRADGWFVEAVANGEEAILAAGSFKPHVIVMDLSMPVLDGFEATRRLKRDERTRHIPVVVCTGLERHRAWVAARSAGCNAFVAKPCSPDDLRALVEHLVATRDGSSA
jgi:CheY-like chemotaxis protein